MFIENHVEDQPAVGETVLVVASLSSKFTNGNGVHAAVRYSDLATLQNHIRAGNGNSTEVKSLMQQGSVVTLAEGEELVIISNELLFEEVYKVRVLTGPHTGKILFIAGENVGKVAKAE